MIRKPWFWVLVCFTAVLGCAGSSQKADLYERGGAVAVWDFEDLSPMPVAIGDLGELLSMEVVKVFQEDGSHDVVERQKLLLALEELNLGSSRLADESTQLKLGRMVGARWMVFGGYQVVGDTMRLDLRKVNVETGAIVKAASQTSTASNISGWLAGARKAARELFGLRDDTL